MRGFMKGRNLTIALVMLLAALGAYFFFFTGTEDPSETYLTAVVERGDVRRTVSATGLLQPVITVQVGSQVSGRIQALFADFNSVVTKGQTLAVIDPANFEAQRERARAALATATASVMNADANLKSRRAEVTSAKANLEVARVDEKEAVRQLKRARELFQEKLISERDFETAEATHEQSRARVQQAEAQIQQVEASIHSSLAQLDQAHANVQQSQAELRMAEVNLRYTKITSPISGVVVERSVDIGQTVAASFQAPVLFLIANDLSKMQVIAQIDEADIGAISENAKVNFSVDAFPEETFVGRISEIRLSSKLPGSESGGNTQSAGGATNVVVYNVIVDVENRDLKLRPSMTANVTFTVASVEDTLKIPNVALRYRPADRKGEFSGRSSGSTAAASPQSGRPGEADRRAGRRPAGIGEKDSAEQTDAEPMRHSPEAGPPTGSSAQPIVGPSMIEQYGVKTGLKIRFPQAEQSQSTRNMVWVLSPSGQPEPRRVVLGITDGRATAVLRGRLKEGDEVVTFELSEDDDSDRTSSPFGSAFGPRRRSGQSSNRRRR